MGTTVLHYSKIGAEDLALGTGTFEVELSDGRKATLNEINLNTFAGVNDITNAVYFRDSTGLGQNALFTYDEDAGQVTLGADTRLRIGSSGTNESPDSIHVAVDGRANVRIENSGMGSADSQIEFALHGSVDWNITCDDSDSDNLKISSTSVVSSTPHLCLFRGATVVGIGTITQGSFLGQGLAIDQGANDDHIIELRSSDVTHGVTDNAPTDTYAYGTKFNGGNGGLLWVGISGGSVGMGISGVATTETTTTTDSSPGVIELTGFLKSGSGTGPLGATGNVLTVRNENTRVLIVKGDGDVHNSGGSTAMGTYDAHNDVQLLQTVKGVMDVSYRERLGEWVDEHISVLERGGIVTRNGDKWFISQRGWRGLLIDTIGQLDSRLRALEPK